jgi:hypothetical protein
METSEKIQAARTLYIESAGRQVDSWLTKWCESPIEQLLLVSLLNNGWHTPEFHEQIVALTWMKQQRIRTKVGYLSGSGFIDCFLVLQGETNIDGKDYRLDIALATPGEKYAFELDGHDFHERTKEQASSDKARDRAFTLSGWKVLRYTGSDVHRDPGAIVKTMNALCRDASEEEWERRKEASFEPEPGGGPVVHVPAPPTQGVLAWLRRQLLLLRRFVGLGIAVAGGWQHAPWLVVVGVAVAAVDWARLTRR